MIATKSGMSAYTTQELYDHVERQDALYNKASSWARRNNWPRWKSNSAAICAEIQERMLNGSDDRQLGDAS
jgi:hypothetical protein